jgi:hypothetical protein
MPDEVALPLEDHSWVPPAVDLDGERAPAL